ncbi:MAG: ParB/RepB/Spo0J family partition protein [bacterium]|nr:ParB/RepB/Spo0J family partition protein [bacterium]
MSITEELRKKQAESSERMKHMISPRLEHTLWGTVYEIPLIAIKENIEQAREQYDEESIKNLADSIKKGTLFQPIVVTPDGENYLIVAGHRRYRAYKNYLNLEVMPAMVRQDIDKDDLFLYSLIENTQRQDLNSLEKAKALFKLKDQYKTKDMIAFTGYSKANILKYLQVYKEIKDDKKKEQKFKELGINKGYSYFCKPKKEKKGQEAKGRSIIININNEKNKKNIEKALRRLKEFEDYLLDILKQFES